VRSLHDPIPHRSRHRICGVLEVAVRILGIVIIFLIVTGAIMVIQDLYQMKK
jgi:hypothetical protein